VETEGTLVRRRLAIGAGFGVIGSLLASMASAQGARVAPVNLEHGRIIYERHCADCHGPAGRGDGRQATSLSPRPGNLISAQTSAKSDQDLLNTIAKGKPRTSMSGWDDRLSQDDQAAVLAYIRSLVKFTGSATPPPPQP
jgi:mono/diheme cytochrome c family protein